MGVERRRVLDDPYGVHAAVLVFLRERIIFRAMHGESRGSDDSNGKAMTDEGAAESGEVRTADAPPASSRAPGDSLTQAQAEAARLKEAWLRTAADFDNFRKRTRREIDEARRSGREDLVRLLLPVFDNLERALQSAQRSTDVKAMADGLSMVQRQFGDALGREGIARVPTVGHSFDPAIHEAIQQLETEAHAPGTIIAEVQPGYTHGEKLLRAAMVVVARAKAPTDGDADGAEHPSH
jgi:molecular chaperone GrpE